MAIEILVVDDSAIFRRALASLLDREADMTVVAEADDGESAVRLAAQLAPSLVLMDIGLPGINGVEATRQITAADPDCAVLALSINGGRRLVEQAVAAGATGYVSKQAAGHDLVDAIHALSAGDTYFSDGLTDP